MDEVTAILIRAMEAALAVDNRELVSWRIREKKSPAGGGTPTRQSPK